MSPFMCFELLTLPCKSITIAGITSYREVNHDTASILHAENEKTLTR